ncbi:MAG: N-acetyltransferase [Clostridia bacterium]|nr:N-acetyltransferase [Clostridia bacterium]
MTYRKAHVSDLPAVHRLINEYAAAGLMLPRALGSLYEHIQEISVAVEDGEVLGTASLHVVWEDLAEIRSLATRRGAEGRGIGRTLVQRLVEEARELGVGRVFALTYEVRFFQRCGFHVVPKETLHRKVWNDCLRCPKRFHCDEVAVVRDVLSLSPDGPASGGGEPAVPAILQSVAAGPAVAERAVPPMPGWPSDRPPSS